MERPENDEQQLQDDAELVLRVLKTVSDGQAAVADVYDRAEKDLDFASGLAGSQYGDRDAKLRGKGRVKQQFSLVNQYIERVMGLYDAAPYGVQVSPLTDEAADMARTTQGIVDAIQANSSAKNAYRTALRNATTCGYGWIAVSTNWASDTDETGDVVVSIEPVLDPFAVVIDPASTETDGRDAEWIAYTERIPASKAAAMFGDDVLEPGAGEHGFAVERDSCKKVDVVTYYERSKAAHEIDLGGGVKKRVREQSVDLYRIVNKHLVERRQLALSRVPIVPVYGLPVRYQGANSYVGIVHRARDAQRNLNAAISTGAERLALSPTMKIMAPAPAVAGHEKDFADANRTNNTLLKYEPYDPVTGKAFAAPVKVDPAVDNSDIANMYALYSRALSAVIGIPEDGIGAAPGREQTAEETLLKAKAAETVLSTLYSNLSTSVSAVGRVIVETIADAYRGTRSYMTSENGQIVRRSGDFDAVRLNPGDLAVDIDAGPLLGTQRKENLRSLISLLSISPDTFRPVVFAQACRYIDGVDDGFKQNVDKIALFTMQQAVQGAGNAQQLVQENQALKTQLAEAQRALLQAASDQQASETRTRADLLKVQLQNQNRLDVEALKQQGETGRTILDAQMDAERDARRAYAEFEQAAAAERDQAAQNAALLARLNGGL